MTSDRFDPHTGRQQLAGYLLGDYAHAIAMLAMARENLGLSLADIARRTGGSKGSLSEALRGDQELGGCRLFALAHALGYDLALVPRPAARLAAESTEDA